MALIDGFETAVKFKKQTIFCINESTRKLTDLVVIFYIIH